MGRFNITVYCSSSSHLEPVYYQAGAELGRQIALRGWGLVYGGNRIGLMKSLADGVQAAGGRVIGVTPQFMVDEGIGDELADELVVTRDMRERKAIMEERGDGFIALPGGLGTMEEIFEIMVGRSLGCHGKPITILNVAGYYDPLAAMLRHGIDAGFIREKASRLWCFTEEIDEALDYLQANALNPPRPLSPQKPVD